jgi:copper oxidase (laccase) domain-containing protein
MPGLAIGVLTADCVRCCSPTRRRRRGAAHAAGAQPRPEFRGTAETAARRQGTRSRGHWPAINQNYEVGPEFEAQLLDGCPNNAKFFVRSQSGERAHFDLPGFVESRLAAAGIGEIERCCPCTYANESLFYSYRRSQHRGEADYGRQISAIVVA